MHNGKLAVSVGCCLQTCNSVVNMVVMGLVLGAKFDGIIYHCCPVTMQKYPVFIMYCEVCYCLHVVSAHWAIVCEVSYTYLLGCLETWKRHFN